MRNPYHSMRPGFTIIELLIVLGIMMVLMVLGVGAALKSYAYVQTRNTEITERKLLDRFQRRNEQIYGEAKAWEADARFIGLGGGNTRRSLALKVKFLYKWSFPMNYTEAETNVTESQNYGFAGGLGHPLAVAIRNRLRQRRNIANAIATPLIPTSTTIAEQNAACLGVIYELTFATFIDELTSEEVQVQQTSTDLNPRPVDAWGTPLFFVRYGHLDCTLHPELLALFGPRTDIAGLPAATYGQYHHELVQRARLAFINNQGTDPDDPENLLPLGWRTQAGTYWLPPAPSNANGITSGFTQTFHYFMPASGSPRIFAPFAIISAGRDRNFATWDDNIDSYRLQHAVAGQQ